MLSALQGSVSNMNVVDWAVMLMENGTKALFNDFVFQNNVGGCLPQQRLSYPHDPARQRRSVLLAYVLQHPAAGMIWHLPAC